MNTSTQFVANLIGAATDGAAIGDNVEKFTTTDKRALVSLKYSEKKDQAIDAFTAGWHVFKFNNFHSDAEDIYGERPEEGEGAIVEQFASVKGLAAAVLLNNHKYHFFNFFISCKTSSASFTLTSSSYSMSIFSMS